MMSNKMPESNAINRFGKGFIKIVDSISGIEFESIVNSVQKTQKNLDI